MRRLEDPFNGPTSLASVQNSSFLGDSGEEGTAEARRSQRGRGEERFWMLDFGFLTPDFWFLSEPMVRLKSPPMGKLCVLL
jgi:hypothetical protein